MNAPPVSRPLVSRPRAEDKIRAPFGWPDSRLRCPSRFHCLLVALWLGACTSSLPLRQAKERVLPPAETLSAYRFALEHDDPASAYELLAPELKRRFSKEVWRAEWDAMKSERTAQLKRLAEPPQKRGATPQREQTPQTKQHPSAGSVEVKAVVALPQGTALMLLPSPSFGPSCRVCWSIANPDLAAVHAETPEKALELFIHALEQRNYRALLRLLSFAQGQAIEQELRERTERLRTSLAQKKSVPNPATAIPPGPSALPPAGSPSPTPTFKIYGDRIHYQYDPRFFIDLVREKDGWRILETN